MAALSRALDAVSALVVALAGAALVALVAITGWMVFGRYVLNDTPTWVERAATLIVVAISMPVAAVGVRERFHLSVLGFRDALPGPARRAVAVACDAAVALFGAAMAWWSWELVEGSWRFRTPLIGISQGWTYAPLVLGGALMALFGAEQVARGLMGLDRPQTAAAALE